MIPSIEQAKEGSEVPPLSMELDTETGLPGQSEQPGKPEVHPLEALFKRAAPQEAAKGSSLSPKSPRKPPPIDTSKAAFSFFDADAALDEAQENGDGEAAAGAQGRPNLTLPPMTPVTKRDFHMRGLRSAAPEPDTATHERHFDFGAALDRIREGKEGSEDGISGGQSSSNSTSDVESDDDDEEEHDNGNDHGGEVNGESKQESEWRKWFYEHRGENNRAWRQKRREAMKLKRQRENRRLARKIIA
ncbi:MAG: hypothetical protein INR71_11430 [Terriglobus roseus]|nr:hypothetical protein [Terriglobus roseus]